MENVWNVVGEWTSQVTWWHALVVFGSAYLLKRVLFPPPPDSWAQHVFPHQPLQTLYDPLLYSVTGSLGNSGLPRNAVMYVLPSIPDADQVVLSDDDQSDKQPRLLIHSAIACCDATMKEIESLGKPTLLVVPNAMHRADAAVYKERYPEIQVLCPEGAQSSVNKVVPVDDTLQNVLPKYGIEVIPCSQAPSKFSECMLLLPLHSQKASSLEKEYALIVCDTLFNLKSVKGIVSNIIGWLFGSLGPLKMTRLGKMFGDKVFVANIIQQLLEKYNHRIRVICVAHGDPILHECNHALEEARNRILQ